MKKEIPGILLERAEKYSIEASEDFFEFSCAILNKLKNDTEVTHNHLLAIFELGHGAKWIDSFFSDMIWFALHPDGVEESDILSANPYSQLFSDPLFLSTLSLASSTIAIGIITTPVLCRVMCQRTDLELTELYGEICCKYPEVANYIFISQSMVDVIQPMDDVIQRFRRVIATGPGAPMRLASILIRVLDASNQSEQTSWCEIIYSNNYSRNTLARDEPPVKFWLFHDNENAAKQISLYILSHYKARPWFAQLDGFIVDIGLKWPIFASEIIKIFAKDDLHLALILKLIPKLMECVELEDIPSLEIYALLLLTGFASPIIKQDDDLFLRVCLRLLQKNSAQRVVDIASSLVKNNISELFNIPERFVEDEISNKPKLAYNLCQLIITSKDHNDENARVKTQEIADDLLFLFKLAKHFQENLEYEDAILHYSKILKITKKICYYSSWKIKIVEEDDAGNVTEILTPEKKQLRDEFERNFREQCIPQNVTLQLGRLWSDRLNRFVQDPSVEPNLYFYLGRYFFNIKDLNLSYKLLMASVVSDLTQWDDPFLLELCLALIMNGDFEKGIFLLKHISSGKNCQQAQNLIMFFRDIDNAEDASILNSQPLLTRLNIIQFLLPIYRKAININNESIIAVLKKLEEEYKCLLKFDGVSQRDTSNLIQEKSPDNMRALDNSGIVIPLILFEYAQKYEVYIDRKVYVFAKCLLAHMCAYKRLTQEYILCILEFCQGTKMFDEIREILNRTDNDIKIFSKIILNVKNLNLLSRNSPYAAIMIIKEKPLRNIIEKQSVSELATLYSELCSQFSELADFIFSNSDKVELYSLNMYSDENSKIPKKVKTEESRFTLKIFDAIKNAPDAPNRLLKIVERIFHPSNYNQNWEMSFIRKFIVHDFLKIMFNSLEPGMLFKRLSQSEYAIYHAVDYFLHHYNSMSHNKKAGEQLVEVGLKWPRLAAIIITLFPKDERHLMLILQLLPALINEMKQQDLPSMFTYAMLALTGITPSIVEQNTSKAMELCEQLFQLGDILSVSIMATAFANGEISESFHLVQFREKFFKVPQQVGFAYRLFQRIVSIDESFCDCIVPSYLENPKFLSQVGIYYQENRDYGMALEVYLHIFSIIDRKLKKVRGEISVLKNSFLSKYTAKNLDSIKKNEKDLTQTYADLSFNIALVISNGLNQLSKKQCSDPTLCFYLATLYYNIHNLELSFKLLMLASLSEKYFVQYPLCIDLSLSLIRAGYFDKGTALLKKIPPGVNFDKAQNLLKHTRVVYDEEFSLGDLALLSFTRLDSIELILPYYRKASTAGHEQAQVLLRALETEYDSLKHPDKKLPKWAPNFTSRMSEDSKSNDQGLQDVENNQYN